MTHVAVAYHVDQSRYANVGRGDRRHTLDVYWRNIAVMFASLTRWTASEGHRTVFSNSRPPERIGRVLERLGVDVTDIGYTQPYPSSFFPAYRGAFHLFDVVHHYAETLQDDERAVVVDPDCLWVADPRPLFEVLARDGMLVHDLVYPETRRANGVGRADMRRIFEELDGRGRTAAPAYVGGEILGVTGRTARLLSPVLRDVTARNVDRWRAGKPALNTEEHVLSYLVDRLQARGNTAPYLRRLWTGPRGRKISSDPRRDEYLLTIWHLPAEKQRGIYGLLPDVEEAGSWFWTAPDREWVELMAARVGIDRRRLDPLLRLLQPLLVRALGTLRPAGGTA